MKKISLLLFLFSCVMFIGSFLFSINDAIFMKNASSVDGYLMGGHTELSFRSGQKNSPSYYTTIYVATVLFTTKDKKTIKFNVNLDTVNHPKDGTTVQVLYDPKNPQTANLASQVSTSRDLIICISGFILAIASFLFYKKASQNS